MTKYLDIEKLMKDGWWMSRNYQKDEKTMVYETRKMTDFPTTDVAEVKRGKWVWLSSTYDRSPCEMRFWCSECHHETIVHTNGTSEPWEHYCPNCGAKMC